MVEDVIPTLDDPRVLSAKRSFESRKRRKFHLTFEECYAAFNTTRPLDYIRQRVEVSGELVWIVFRQDFCGLFSSHVATCLLRQIKEYRSRIPVRRPRALVHQHKKRVAQQLVSSRPRFEYVREIMHRARLHQLEVELVPAWKKAGVPLRVYDHLLLISGRLTRVYCVKNFYRAPRSCSRVGLIRRMLEEVEMVVFYVAPPGFPARCFVVPSKLLQRVLFSPNCHTDRKQLNIPLKKWPARDKRQVRIDIWEYREAWLLFLDAPHG